MVIDWNESYESGRDYPPMNQVLLSKILIDTGVSTGEVLDAGCGTGDLTVKLAMRGYRVTGIDISSVAINKASERAKEAKVDDRIAFHVLDIGGAEGNPRLQDKKYDIVVCKLVFAFITDKSAFLSWVRDHLRKKGCFVLITPVLHDGLEYSNKLKSISVDYSELQAVLRRNFNNINEVYLRYFDEWGDERTYVVR